MTEKPFKSTGKLDVARAPVNRRFSVAPMMDWSDRHCRYFWRQLSEHAVLYTEMVTTGALLYGNVEQHLRYNQEEHPIALQLGGSEPDALARCAEMAEQWGYDEVNLNCGCPSDRVQNGAFGACLMAEPALVAKGIKAMQDACGIPVTVKHRIGIDDQDSESDLFNFVDHVANAGCKTIIVHARKAWLKGLSPKENRDIPPLDYDRVYRLKEQFPELEIIINGGIETIEASKTHLQQVDGVMVGRAAYQNPYLLSEVDRAIYGSEGEINRQTVMDAMLEYVEREIAQGAKLNYITRHILGLYNGLPGAKQFRRHLSENAYKVEANADTLRTAASLVKAA